MPLNPQYVQRVSEESGGAPRSFVNLSSQMQDPGALPAFFSSQNIGYIMPFTDADIRVPAAPIEAIVNEDNNVSALPKTCTLAREFAENNEPKQARFRTGSMRMWKVPLSWVDMRATDAIY